MKFEKRSYCSEIVCKNIYGNEKQNDQVFGVLNVFDRFDMLDVFGMSSVFNMFGVLNVFDGFNMLDVFCLSGVSSMFGVLNVFDGFDMLDVFLMPGVFNMLRWVQHMHYATLVWHVQ